MESLEDHRAASTILSIDFEKAFNRMGHEACLEAITSLGAESGTVGLIHAFLEGRTMSVRVGDSMSAAKAVPGGSPQGSILGNDLFCATTDGVTKDIEYTGPASTTFEELATDGDVTVPEEAERGEVLPVGQVLEANLSNNTRTSEELETNYNDSALDESINFHRVQQRYEFDSDSDADVTWTQHQIDRAIGIPPSWTDKCPGLFIYIDDANSVEKVRVPGSVVTISQNRQLTSVHAWKSEEVMNTVTVRAERIGMKVNQAKTQLLCISASNSSDISSYIKHGNQKIVSGQELKILGFKFSTQPTVKLHVSYMLEKARKKLWILRHVKKAGVGEDIHGIIMKSRCDLKRG